jgi:hypothetical protein
VHDELAGLDPPPDCPVATSRRSATSAIVKNFDLIVAVTAATGMAAVEIFAMVSAVIAGLTTRRSL